MNYEKSCGTVVRARINGDSRYLLVKNKKSGHWGFPKGHVEPGETEEQTALRETREEAGIDARLIGGFRYTIAYQINRDIHKTVVYFPAETLSNRVIIQPEEITDYLWLDGSMAKEKITYASDREVFINTLAFLKEKDYENH